MQLDSEKLKSLIKNKAQEAGGYIMQLDSEMRIIISIVIILLVLSIFVVTEDNQWEKFKLEHECKIVSYISGALNSGVGINPNNGGFIIVNTVTPEKIGYLCNDGVTYYR